MGNRAVGLEQVRQGAVVNGEVVGHALGVLRRLRLHSGQRARGLGLDDPGNQTVHVEQVIREAEPGPQGELAHRDAAARGQVHLPAILHAPARGLQPGVDFPPGEPFGRIRHPGASGTAGRVRSSSSSGFRPSRSVTGREQAKFRHT